MISLTIINNKKLCIKLDLKINFGIEKLKDKKYSQKPVKLMMQLKNKLVNLLCLSKEVKNKKVKKIFIKLNDSRIRYLIFNSLI